jgi:hypothetical protein
MEGVMFELSLWDGLIHLKCASKLFFFFFLSLL